MIKKLGIGLFILLGLSACMTFYTRYAKFNSAFENGNLKEASSILKKDKKAEENRNRFLFFVNQGVVLHMMGQYQLSNQYFEKAYQFSENYRRNYLEDAASFLGNPTITTYKGEDHEVLYLNFYKALNYIYLGDYNAALVECKQMNIRVGQFNDKYKKDSRLTDNAFIHLMMGVIYEANKDVNNAFIAYRNAYNTYKEQYSKHFNTKIPEQLKKDLLRTSHIMGFDNEYNQYRKEFGFEYDKSEKGKGTLVYFWLNGLGPVKWEWSINFTVVKGQGGYVTFVNEDLGLNFNFRTNDQSGDGGLNDLRLLRVTFPKYLERNNVFNSAIISAAGKKSKLSLVEPVNDIAFKSLEDRMLLELGKSLLRVGLKKAAEAKARKENEYAGTAVTLINAFTEKADTRNWQTLPHDIHYGRLSLPEGQHNVTLETNGKSTSQTSKSVNIRKGRYTFQTFHSLEHLPLRY